MRSPPRPPSRPPPGAGAGVALIAVLWAYDGWGELLYAAGEVKDPGRNLPRALIGGSLVVAAVYVLVNASYLWVMPVAELAASEHVASDAAIRIFGPVGASLVAGLVVVSTFGALNATLLGGPRVFYALAEDGLFFRPVGRIHARWGTPAAAIIAGDGAGGGVRLREDLRRAGPGLHPGTLALLHPGGLGRLPPAQTQDPTTRGPTAPSAIPGSPGSSSSPRRRCWSARSSELPARPSSASASSLAGAPAYYLWRRGT